MSTPTHYQPTGAGPTPWDLQKTMQTSGSCFVDARRTDAIEYCYRVKDDLLGDLKKARHCLDEAIAELEGNPRHAPVPQPYEPPYTKGTRIGKSSCRRRITRAIPDGCTAHRSAGGVEFRRGNEVVRRWAPAQLKCICKPNPSRSERRPSAEMVVFPNTEEHGATSNAAIPVDKPKEQPTPQPSILVAATRGPGLPVGLMSAQGLLVEVWPDKSSRPSLRWLREMQSRRAIPFIKMSRRVFFEPDRVRAALRKFEVGAM